MTVFLFLVELAMLFLCLKVFDSPGFHCILQTSYHFPPRWFPFSFFISHLIAKSNRFPFKAQFHSNFFHRLHRFHNDCILLFHRLSSQSINWSTCTCSRQHAVLSPGTYPSATSVLFRLSLSSGKIVHRLSAFPTCSFLGVLS